MAKSANPLSVRNFRLLFIGESISILGDQFAMIALPWLVLQLTGSSVALGTVLALMSIPRAVFMLVGGVVVDRFSPRSVMIFSNIARMILVGILTALVVGNATQMWILFAFALAFGLTDAFYYPAQNSLVPQLLTKDQLQAGNSLVQGAAQLSALVGPALAGIIISSFARTSTNGSADFTGIGVALFIDTLSFVATIITSYLIRIEGVAKIPTENVIKAIKEGARYVWDNQTLRVLLLVVTFINFFVVGPFNVGIPVLAERVLPEGAAAYGIVTGAFGAGAVIGIMLSLLLTKTKNKYFGQTIMILIALQGLSLAFLPFSSNTTIVSLISLLMGCLNGYTNIVAFTWLQKRIPEELMGRVISLVMFASFGLVPISSFISGFILDVNMVALFVGGGFCTIIFSAACLLLPAVKQMRND